MAGYLFSAVGVLYAVLLGFVVVVVWEKYDATIANVQDEVDAAGDLYHVVDGFPETLRTRIRTDLTKYAQTVIRVEWPAMAKQSRRPRDRFEADRRCGVYRQYLLTARPTRV